MVIRSIDHPYIIHTLTSASIFEHHLDPAGFEGYSICLLVAEVKELHVSGSPDEGRVIQLVVSIRCRLGCIHTHTH